MTHLSPLLITIRSTEDGYYRWELRDGPDGAFEFSGYAPLLERCFEEIIRAQWALAEHLTSDRDPLLCGHSHDTSDPAPIPQVHPPSGHPLPAQQDVPASVHPSASTDSVYPLPSSSG